MDMLWQCNLHFFACAKYNAGHAHMTAFRKAIVSKADEVVIKKLLRHSDVFGYKLVDREWHNVQHQMTIIFLLQLLLLRLICRCSAPSVRVCLRQWLHQLNPVLDAEINTFRNEYNTGDNTTLRSEKQLHSSAPTRKHQQEALFTHMLTGVSHHIWSPPSCHVIMLCWDTEPNPSEAEAELQGQRWVLLNSVHTLTWRICLRQGHPEVNCAKNNSDVIFTPGT